MFEGSRIRADLWWATLDFRSGKRYAWDDSQQQAREAAEGETENILPTVSDKELASWRTEFAQQHRDHLQDDDRAALEHWRAQGLRTSALPSSLQGPWNRTMQARVVERLTDWFRGYASLDADIEERRAAGDQLGVGELFARQFERSDREELEALFVNAIAAWASPLQFKMEVTSTHDLVDHMEDFVPEHLAVAFVHASARLNRVGVELPPSSNDLVFRLAEPIANLFEVIGYRSIGPLAASAVARLEKVLSDMRESVQTFSRTNTVTAKGPSIEVVRTTRRYARFALPAERPLLREVEILLGSAFRKFCESCERHEAQAISRRAAELSD